MWIDALYYYPSYQGPISNATGGGDLSWLFGIDRRRRCVLDLVGRKRPQGGTVLIVTVGSTPLVTGAATHPGSSPAWAVFRGTWPSLATRAAEAESQAEVEVEVEGRSSATGQLAPTWSPAGDRVPARAATPRPGGRRGSRTCG